jgi:hypothetical protein
VLPLLTDENFNGDIVRGLRRRRPEIDLLRVQDVGLSGALDPPILLVSTLQISPRIKPSYSSVSAWRSTEEGASWRRVPPAT